jgi:hypothetical protein
MKMSWAVTGLSVLNLALLAVLGSQMLPAAAKGGDVSPVLRTRGLEIVDDRGTLRATIQVLPGGKLADGTAYPEAVVFRLNDSSGAIRVKLGATDAGSGLVLMDDARLQGVGGQAVGVHLDTDKGGGSIKIRGADGREQIVTP